MVRRPKHGAHAQAIAAWLLLAGLLLRALVPDGFMPDMSALAKGRLHLTICSAGDAPSAMPDMAPAKPAEKHAPAAAPHERLVCPFALALAVFGPVILPLLCALLFGVAAACAALPARFISGRIYPPFSARGPPLFA